MNIPNETIYNILSSITGVEVYYRRPEVIESFPSISYYISENTPTVTLDKSIAFQRVEVVVDIWTETLKEGADILQELESTMRVNNFVLSFSSEVSDPAGVSHITTRFNFIS